MNIYPSGDTPPQNGNGRNPHQATTLVPVHHARPPSAPAHGEDIAGGLEDRRVKIPFLRSLPLFADMPPGDLSGIAEMSTPRQLRRRKVIYFPEDPADALYIVIQGRVKVSRLSEDGKEVTLFLAGQGEPFGEDCLLGAAARETIAEVLEPAHILRVPREALVPFLHNHPAFALAVAGLMSGRRRLAEVRLEEMIFRTVRGRLAALLARLARMHGRRTDGGILLDLSLAHQDLAAQIGSTRETTTLTLNEFKRGGLLRIDHCRILIRDLAGLEAIA